MTEPPGDPLPPPPRPPGCGALKDLTLDTLADAERLTTHLLTEVRRWAPGARAAVDFRGAADLRRRTSPIFQTVSRRWPNTSAALDAGEAGRIIDRVCGLTVREGQRRRLIRSRHAQSRDLVLIKDLKIDTDVCFRMANPPDGEFDAALRRAREAGSLSVPSVLAQIGDSYLTEEAKTQRDQLTALAADGLTSRQIAAALRAGGSMASANHVRQLARTYGIAIPADDVGGKHTRRINPLTIIEQSIPALDGTGSALQHLSDEDIARIDPEQAAVWAKQLAAALAPITAVRRKLHDRGRNTHR